MASLFRILYYGIIGFRRNIWLAIIAIITMTMTIVTMTVFVLSDIAANQKYQELNGRLDYAIFIKDSASEADVELFRQQVAAQSSITKVVYITKEDARLKFEQDFQGISTLQGIITADNNPLPREVDVKFVDPSKIDAFNTFVGQSRFAQVVESTSYSYEVNRSEINNYLRSTNFLKIFGFSFNIFFLLIAVIIILNTLRLTIFSRRDEIEIMRLVGATQSYIRGPFLVEGVLVGLLGALLAAIISWLLLYQLQQLVAQNFGSGNSLVDSFRTTLGSISTAKDLNHVFAQILLAQLLIGVSFGAFCSAIAVRRYLKE